MIADFIHKMCFPQTFAFDNIYLFTYIIDSWFHALNMFRRNTFFDNIYLFTYIIDSWFHARNVFPRNIWF